MAAHVNCWTTCCDASDLRPRRLTRASVARGSGRRMIVGSLRVGVEDVAEIVHNKVLIAAAASAAVGQLSKPFTSALLYGKGFNMKAAARSGGFPSTHSAAVVAAATSLALERGFSDSVFGMAVVYAALVMYDAQGVRMEVGKHAQVMNRVLLNDTINTNASYDTGDSTAASACRTEQTLHEEAEEASRYSSSPTLVPTLLRQDNLEESEEARGESHSIVIDQLKESVGHTKVEVTAGALLGFFTGLIIHASNVI